MTVRPRDLLAGWRELDGENERALILDRANGLQTVPAPLSHCMRHYGQIGFGSLFADTSSPNDSWLMLGALGMKSE